MIRMKSHQFNEEKTRNQEIQELTPIIHDQSINQYHPASYPPSHQKINWCFSQPPKGPLLAWPWRHSPRPARSAKASTWTSRRWATAKRPGEGGGQLPALPWHLAGGMGNGDVAWTWCWLNWKDLESMGALVKQTAERIWWYGFGKLWANRTCENAFETSVGMVFLVRFFVTWRNPEVSPATVPTPKQVEESASRTFLFILDHVVQGLGTEGNCSHPSWPMRSTTREQPRDFLG